MGLGRVLNMSARSLATYQRALAATSNNIANANNPHFTRQRVQLTPEIGDKYSGYGVRFAGIQRVRDTLTDSQIRTFNQTQSDAEKRTALLSQVEIILAEPTAAGLSNVMNNFFNSWNELSVTPNSAPLRLQVLSSASNLSNKVESLWSGLNEVRTSLFHETNNKLRQLNSFVDEIRTLNQKIFETGTIGIDPSNLKDRRDEVVEELSKLANINLSEDDQGSYNISIGGVFATDRYYAHKFEAKIENDRIAFSTKDGVIVNIQGGELNALSSLYNEKIPSYQKRIDDIAITLMDNVNAIHASGFNLKNPPVTGVNFFDGYSKGKLSINQDILDDLSRLAISSNGNSGNGDLATRIAELQNQQLLNGKKLSENYAVMVSELGVEKAAAESTSTTNKLILEKLEVQRKSVAGVSVDEEMTNVIMFQRSYEAAAKLIRVADEMLQTLLNMV
ncbi:MAG: flagellar hook-associated protein FlgK [Chlorobiaceae bacterium]|nr:flagellar hook-associated protein FlgK [Chlorobiaceae bacterium]